MNPMLEEVVTQPAALSGLRKYYASPGAIPSKPLRKLVTDWPPTVVFTGMGSSLFAAYPAQVFLSSVGIRSIVWETADLLHHHLKFLGPDILLVMVSQSGETVEILRLLKSLPRKVGVVGVVNESGSTLAQHCDMLLPMMSGRQMSVSTRTYMCSVAALMYLACEIARRPPGPLSQALKRVIEAQEKILERRDTVTQATAEFFDEPSYVALLSRGADLSSIFQGALMLKEVVRLGAEAMSAAQFRHGPIEIINPLHRYVVIARQGARGHATKTGRVLVGLAEEIRSHGGRVLLITDLAFRNTTNVRLIPVEPLPFGLGTLVDSLHIQLLTYELALRAGLEPGKFWIAEDVTRVE